jgi:hypothetical protein
MLRLSIASTPGGGYQTFGNSYGSGSPNTSVSTLHATGGSSITTTTFLDPYGRTKETDTTDTLGDEVVPVVRTGFSGFKWKTFLVEVVAVKM